MSLLDQIFSIAISSQSAAPSRPGFGTALLLTYHTRFANRVRTYSSTAAMVSDGFLTTDYAYKWASAYFAQNPAPQKLKIGRRAVYPANVSVLTINASPPTGGLVSVNVGGTTFSYTVTAGQTATQVATAVAALITASLPAGLSTAVGSTASVVCTAAAGFIVNMINLSPSLAKLSFSSSQDPTADLVACAAEDNDWYALAIDAADKADSILAATWAESNKKLFPQHSAEDACVDGTSTTDLAYAAKTAAYGRTGIIFHRAGGTLSTITGALLGSRLPADPGSDTWAFKTLPGQTADTLTDTEITALQAKRASFYVTAANINFTNGGQVAGGEWFDVVRGLDWLRSELQIAQFSLALNRAKIPFTDVGIAMVVGVLKSVFKRAEKVGLFAPNSTTVTAPAAADVSTADKAARLLSGVVGTGTLAGAIHSTTVSATVSV